MQTHDPPLETRRVRVTSFRRNLTAARNKFNRIEAMSEWGLSVFGRLLS